MKNTYKRPQRLKLYDIVFDCLEVVDPDPILTTYKVIRPLTRALLFELIGGITRISQLKKFCRDAGIEPPDARSTIPIKKAVEILQALGPDKYV
ncbi:hypothetical protein EXU85_22675 [Spirosoma sp. KCTC 42546]|uniref:hypothetical protein n=1 Tax=Spirosoma sp. KCTC 42546 TaxID=2520506 RepID=UPI00115A620B|nr:hypothetical protein [Spirosoma sp. KCTC 42546]QDK81261.1 hypothetical protein EXU85_22675 [Spirosoma sp. KCTC 42546]